MISGKADIAKEESERCTLRSTGVMATACIQEEDRCNTGSPLRGRGIDQPEAGDGQAGRDGVAERPAVLRMLGNASGGKGL